MSNTAQISTWSKLGQTSSGVRRRSAVEPASSTASGDLAFLVLVTFVSAIPRLFLLWITDAGIESDEAIVGLMAKHINAGREWPIFYYGQPYMGSLEAFVAALYFKLFGQSNLSLKLVPFTFSLFLIPAVYLLARQVTDRLGARIATLLVALPPSTLVIWSSKARGGFMELVFLGTLTLLLTSRIFSRRSAVKANQRNLSFWYYTGLGALAGLGWWTNNQMIFYLLASSIVAAMFLLQSDGIRRGVKILLVSLSGFALGSAPFWYFNLVSAPRLQTFYRLGETSDFDTTLKHLAGFFQQALPILLGARRLWDTQGEVFPGATVLVYLVLAISLLLFPLVRSRSQAFAANSSVDREGSAASWPKLQLLVFSLVVPVVFSHSALGWLSQEPRYLLPIYSVVFIFTGAVCSWLLGLQSFIPRVFGGFLLVAQLAVNLSSNYLNTLAVPDQPFVHKGERVMENQQPLYQWLLVHGYNHVFTNYWIGYRMAFETDEQITFSVFRGDAVVRIPEYQDIGYGLSEQEVVLVVVPSQMRELVGEFARQGYLYRANRVGQYVVIDGIRPAFERGPEIDLKQAKITVPSRGEWIKSLADESLGTRWGSGEPQHNGMVVEIRFDKTQVVSGIDLHAGFWPQDSARALRVEGIGTDGAECLLATAAPAVPTEWSRGDFGAKMVSFYFPPRQVAAIKLIQEGQDSVFDWSIAEINIYGEPSVAE